ncbi:MAG: glycoside hydrolase family 88 protein [Lachnospiraceae bacterium]|nr:glycoside hydrolase family 88 protein [Lachnospiraceae bacterium]
MAEKRPIEYAKAACDMMMRKFDAPLLPPVNEAGVTRFHYHQGVFLSGMQKTYALCGDRRYLDYIKAWVDACFDAEGNLKWCDRTQLDDMQAGILLFRLLDEEDNPLYRKTLDELVANIEAFPKNKEGGFWHKGRYPNQMWLDGLYMAGPITAEYAKRNNRPDLSALVIEQALMMEKNTRDEKTGLLYHAYDESREAPWSDPVTGRSPEFWGRAIGWVPVAVLDDLEFLDPGMEGYDGLQDLVRNLLHALLPFQTESGMWYQVVDKPEVPGNWPETSCTCLYVAAICKAIRLGLLSGDKPGLLDAAKKGFDAVISRLEWDENGPLIGGVCVGTGVGDWEHYIHRPTSVNDLHGVGAFLLMCEEAEQVL